MADDVAQALPVGGPRHRHGHDPRPVPGHRRGGAPAHRGAGRVGALRPRGPDEQITALPIQIYGLTSKSQEAFPQAASAAIIVLLVMVLGLNALAIFIRNKFQRSW